MDEQDDNEIQAQISEMIGAMATLFPNAEISTTVNRSYVKMLKDIPLPVLTAAIDQSIAECRFLPTVADIRERADVLTRAEQPAALQAWKTVINAIQRYGYNRSITGLQEIEAENPIAAEATRCLGWLELCNSDNQVADRAHFSKVYDQLVARKDADRRLLPAAREIKALNRGPIIAQLIGKQET